MAGSASHDATTIFDSAIWEGPGRDYELPPNPHVIEACAPANAPVARSKTGS